MARSAVSERELVGVVPGSLGCFVIDIDTGGNAAVETVIGELGEPVACIPARRAEGFHLFYKADASAPPGNRNHQFGDYRHQRGFVILWDTGELLKNLEAGTHEPKRISEKGT